MKLADTSTRTRGPALTPMIDVVFLLLVFFILVARFGPDQALDLTAGGESPAIDGPPRLLDIAPDELRLNGVSVDERALEEALVHLGLGTDDLVVVRPSQGVDLQRLVSVVEDLQRIGFASVAVVEGGQ
jgi:biopolymer transport protein ExbD